MPLGPQPVQTRPGGAASAATTTLVAEPAVATAQESVQHNGLAAAGPSPQGEPHWSADGEAELAKIPFFVRGKVRRNTETFARERGHCPDQRRNPLRRQGPLQPLMAIERHQGAAGVNLQRRGNKGYWGSWDGPETVFG